MINIKTLLHNIQIQEKVSVPIFNEFGEFPEEKIEFLVCKFHDKYDGLIGNNILKKLKATINMGDDILLIGNNKIPLHYLNETAEYCFEKIGIHEVILSVSQKEGLVYNPQTLISNGNIKILKGVYFAENYKINALIEVNAAVHGNMKHIGKQNNTVK